MGITKKKDLKSVFSSKKNTRIVFSVSKENTIHAYLTKSNDIGVARMGEKVEFTTDDLEIFDDWSLIIPEKEKDPSKIFLQSTGYPYLATKGRSAIYIGQNPKPIRRGLNLLYVEDASYKIKYFDTYAHPEAVPDLIKAVDKLIKDNAYFAIVAHDSAGENFEAYKKELRELGFSKLIDLESREAYIAYYTNKTLLEYTDPASISRELELGLIENPEKAAVRKDTKRFIAHAGGKINNLTYTNSLEALDHNYNKGFRLFELDIVKTSDNKYVAAHDWDFWAKRRDYKGALPPTEAEFLKYNYKDLTPLTLDDINAWFKEHEDAILVTDKVNTPKDFYEKFDHKSRLMMELFTVEALKEAQSLELMTPIATHGILRNNKGHELETLQKYDVEYVAVSRRLISENSYLLKQLKNAGIKAYVYHINYEKGKDEQYVVNYEMDYIYGIYADDWDFGN